MQACLAQWFLRTLGSGNLRGSAYSHDEVNLEPVEWCPRHESASLVFLKIPTIENL